MRTYHSWRNKILHQKLCGLKQLQFILSPFWSLEIQNQGVNRDTLSLTALGRYSLPFPRFWYFRNHWCSLAYRHITPVSDSIVTWFLFKFITSHNDTRPQIRAKWDYFNLITSAKILFAKKVMLTGWGVVKTLRYLLMWQFTSQCLAIAFQFISG
jgi:hypothetical protein